MGLAFSTSSEMLYFEQDHSFAHQQLPGVDHSLATLEISEGINPPSTAPTTTSGEGQTKKEKEETEAACGSCSCGIKRVYSIWGYTSKMVDISLYDNGTFKTTSYCQFRCRSS